MFVRRFSNKRWVSVGLASAALAFHLGSSDWAARLFACGNGQDCVGGCMEITQDGDYIDLDSCAQIGNNLFGANQAILGKSSNWLVPGPNVMPVKTGGINWTDTSVEPTLPCNTTMIQEGEGVLGNPQQIISERVCPQPT